MLNIGLGIFAILLSFMGLKWLQKKHFVELSFSFVSLAFGIKMVSGIALTLIYTYYYPIRNLADTFRYFDDSYHLHQLLFENPKQYLQILFGINAEFDQSVPHVNNMLNWFPAQRTSLYNDNRTVIRLNTLLRLLSFGSYYFHLVVFCLLGFLGQLLMFKSFLKYFPDKKTAFALVLFFIPSLVFWSSGILKEGPLLLVFGYLLYVLEKTSRMGWSAKNIVLVGLLFIILFHLKFYVALMIIPIITLYWALNKWKQISPLFIIIGNYFAYFLLALAWHFIRWKWSLFTVFKWKKLDFEGLGKSMNAKSIIETYPLQDNAISFLINVPQGFLNALMRPFIWESYSILLLLSAIENVLIFVFCSACFYFRKKAKWSNMNYCFLLYALSLLTVIGMVTPIMGSLVRYKIPALPFLLLTFLMILDTNKLFKFLNIK